jgi:hypothetical protein
MSLPKNPSRLILVLGLLTGAVSPAWADDRSIPSAMPEPDGTRTTGARAAGDVAMADDADRQVRALEGARSAPKRPQYARASLMLRNSTERPFWTTRLGRHAACIAIDDSRDRQIVTFAA